MKTIEEIYEEMLSVFREETGAEATSASDLSVRLYAVAAQVYGLYAQADWLARQCFPQTAQGEWLDRHAALRNVERQQALRAQGSIRFSVTEPAVADLAIPKGTVCATAGLVRFETTEAATLAAGETAVLVPAQAVEPGEVGNVPAGSILAMTVPPVGIGACINPEAFTGGTGVESDDTLRARVLSTYRRMPNGANAAYYEQEALSFEEVVACNVIPRSRGRGTVDVVVAGPKGFLDGSVVSKIQAHFDQRREIAVDVKVGTPGNIIMTVGISIAVAEGYSAEERKAKVKETVEAYFGGARMGKDLILAQLCQVILSIDGITNCIIKSPTKDMTIGPGKMATLRRLTVEVME